MIDYRALFSLVPTVGDAFWAFGAASKGLVQQQVTIKPGTNLAVLDWSWYMYVCAISSNILDFIVYVCTMALGSFDKSLIILTCRYMYM